MNVDRRSIEKVLSLDDASFRELAKSIANAVGADDGRAAILTANLDLLRTRIAGMSPRDFEQLIEAAGEDRAEQIARALRERGVDIGR